LKDKSELAYTDVKGAKVECQAFVRDGGGVVIDVAKSESRGKR
jgi:hypothetical protein